MNNNNPYISPHSEVIQMTGINPVLDFVILRSSASGVSGDNNDPNGVW